jgi:hypothetical protein
MVDRDNNCPYQPQASTVNVCSKNLLEHVQLTSLAYMALGIFSRMALKPVRWPHNKAALCITSRRLLRKHSSRLHLIKCEHFGEF